MWKTNGSPRENDLPRHGSGGSELLRPATISCQGARWGGENHNGSSEPRRREMLGLEGKLIPQCQLNSSWADRPSDSISPS